MTIKLINFSPQYIISCFYLEGQFLFSRGQGKKLDIRMKFETAKNDQKFPLPSAE